LLFFYLHVVQVAGVISIMKAARQLGMVHSLARIVVPGRADVIIPRSVLERAIRHSSEALRGDVFQLICINPKLSLMPSKYSLSASHHSAAPLFMWLLADCFQKFVVMKHSTLWENKKLYWCPVPGQ